MKPSRTCHPARALFCCQFRKQQFVDDHLGSSRFLQIDGNGDFSFLKEFYRYQIIDYNPALSGGVFTAGNAFTIGYLAVGGAVTVTYDGVPPKVASAPEPSTWAMAFLQFLGLGLTGYSKLKTAFVPHDPECCAGSDNFLFRKDGDH